MMENIRIYLLGTFRLYRNGLLLTAKDWHVRQARQLFKLLFTEREHTIPVDKVIDLLWPYSAEHAHQTLRSAVSILRTVLEPERAPQAPSLFVPRGSVGYTLHLPADDAVWVDTLEFERLLDMASEGPESSKRRKLLASALQLYTGDYLAEDEQECWTFAQRAHLRERYFDAALTLMEMQRKQQLYSEAVAIGRRALSFDTCREPLYRAIMYCQASLGDTVGALQTFEQCRQELQHRLGAYPSPQTLALHTELLQDDFCIEPTQQVSKNASSSSLTRTPPAPLLSIKHSKPDKKCSKLFTEQRNILENLVRSIELLRVKHREPQATHSIVVAGEVGIGKSFLLQSLLDCAQTLHVTTMSTSCQAIEQATIFTPLIAILKMWLTELHDDELSALPHATLAVLSHFIPELLVRLPQLTPIPILNGEQAQSVFITGFVDIFLEISQQRPLVVALDDVQWVDEASLHVLHRLSLVAQQNHALLLLLFYRPEDTPQNEPLQSTLLSLSCCNSSDVMHLSNISIEDVDAYLCEHNVRSSITQEQWYQATQGNPLLLVETVRIYLNKYTQEGASYDNDLLNAMLQSQKIHDILFARIARLPQRALELLELAAVIGRPFPSELLSSLRCSEDCKMLETLLAYRFLQASDREEYEVCLTFSHEILAKIIYTNCSALKRSQLHLQVAERMERHYVQSLDCHAVEIAFHYRHAGPQYQQQVRQYV